LARKCHHQFDSGFAELPADDARGNVVTAVLLCMAAARLQLGINQESSDARDA